MNNLFEVKFISSKKGKGLFAKKNIKKKKIIEIAHVMLIHDNDYEKIQESSLYDYTFTWDDPKFPNHMNAIAFSICQFMNHSYNPNVRYEYDYQKQIVKFVAIRGIEKGKELTVNYNGDRHDKQPVWFEVEE